MRRGWAGLGGWSRSTGSRRDTGWKGETSQADSFYSLGYSACHLIRLVMCQRRGLQASSGRMGKQWRHQKMELWGQDPVWGLEDKMMNLLWDLLSSGPRR